MGKNSKKTPEIKLTSPYNEFMKTARVLNDKRYLDDEERFKRERVEMENEIRIEESRNLQLCSEIGRIDGISCQN